MKKRLSAMYGVTLLEIMLVLAIAAMIIVMSVRYYQSATSSQQANTALEQIQAITAAADSLAQSGGAYNLTSALGGSDTTAKSALGPILPANGLIMPWGATATFSAITASSYTVDIGNVPAGVCPLLNAKLLANNHYTTSSTCIATATVFNILS